MAENGVTYPVIAAPENFLEIFPIDAYPSSFFVGRDGTIIAEPVVGAHVEVYEPTLEGLLSPQE